MRKIIKILWSSALLTSSLIALEQVSDFPVEDPMHSLGLTSALALSTDSQRELSSLGIYQGLGTLNRLNTLIGNALDSMGISYLSMQSSLSSLSSEKIKNEDNQKDKTKERHQELLTSFLIPYYSYASITPFSDVTSSVHSAGLLGGISRRFENDIIFGGHLNLEYQNLQGNNQNIAHIGSSGSSDLDHLSISSASLGLGLHLNIPFSKITLSSSSALNLYLKAQVNTLFSYNAYTLKNAQERAHADSMLYGIDAQILQGFGFQIDSAELDLEVGVQQDYLNRPKFSFNGFKKLHNRAIDVTSMHPTALLAQIKYFQTFQIHSGLDLTPFVKLGLSGIVAGEEFNNRFKIGILGEATHSIDMLKGLATLGFNLQVQKNLHLALSYEGEYASKSKTHLLAFGINYLF